jgi:hypothetical protein
VGIAVRGTIQATGEAHRWRIPSTAGQSIAIWMVDLEGDYTIEAIAPSGSLAGAASSGGAGDLALQVPGAAGGDYIITVTASEISEVPYRLVVTVDAE